MKYPLTDIGQQVLEKRYIHKELGESSWEDVVERVLNHVVPNDKDEYRELLVERYFVPNSPTLVNAGTSIGGLSACFVVPFEDSIEGIAKTKYYFMKIAQKGGGCGTTLSNLRPEGMPVSGSTHSHAGGPIKFFNTICEDMKAMTQAGFREMAMMGTMSVYHPDIGKFIRAKSEEGLMHTTNLSVMVTDDFMNAAEAGDEWKTVYSLGPDREVLEYYQADQLLEDIARAAWENGEPGMIFETTVNDNTPYKYSDQYIDATNPCGEQPLPPFGVCNLGSIDVSKYYDEEADDLKWKQLTTDITKAVHFLDAVIDVSEWPIPEVAEWVKDNRPIGLGIMGFADLLLKMGMWYGSEDSLGLAEKLGMLFYDTAVATSIMMGGINGIPKSCKDLPRPRRNITLLSIAPTGSIAAIAGCSYGIEPIYAPMAYRTDKTGSYSMEHPSANDPWFRSAINPDKSREVTWEEHIEVQAMFQNYVDSGVSKTINLPNDATVEDVKRAFIYAWKMGCKGITVYRDGSRKVQVLNTNKNLDKEAAPVTPHRPYMLESKTIRLKNGGDGNVYVTVGFDEGKPIEVFVNGPSIKLPDVQMRDGFSRLSSLALRYGVPVDRVVKELRQIRATSLKDVPAQIALVLEEVDSTYKVLCKNCGAEMHIVEGCKTCPKCGESECG